MGEQGSSLPAAQASGGLDPVSAALVIDQRTFEALGPVISHLAVGLLDSISNVTLITPAPAALGLSLGPVRVIRHLPLTWPMWHRRFEGILHELRASLPGVIHVFSRESLVLGEQLAAKIGRPVVAWLFSAEDVEAGLRRFGRGPHLVAASAPLQRAAVQRQP